MPISQIEQIQAALQSRQIPTVNVWNRVEPRPRAAKFDRALKAEVRDALWMLSRQWQLGEFQGDDAGSPVFARLHLTYSRLASYQAGEGPKRNFDESLPLEAQVECRPLPLSQHGQAISLDLRILMGRRWAKGVRSIDPGLVARFEERYRIAAPDPEQADQAGVCAHPEVWQTFAAAAGRCIDGGALYLHLSAHPANRAYDGIAGITPVLAAQLDTLAAQFLTWFGDWLLQPDPAAEAWQPDRLEYRFACSTPTHAGEKQLAAEEYYHGRLDWYNFDREPKINSAVPPLAETLTQTLIPVPVAFDGMPNTRWWAFEDSRTNFSYIKPDTTDLAKLLLLEFGLVYANDWFLIPLTMPAGSMSEVQGLSVANVFGERFWIGPAGSGPDDAWQRWSMYTLNIRGPQSGAADTSLLLAPVVPKIQEGRPLEEAYLIRDEVANMVWGIETIIPLPSGAPRPGGEAAAETLAYHRRLLEGIPDPDPVSYQAAIRYELMNSVPEHWIPFIPVHVPGQNREVQLQRASMPRLIKAGQPAVDPVKPRTSLLRQGLDQPVPAAYYLHEEEVPRAGVRITQAYQRTRWYGGKVALWLGVRKQTGRGEAASGLAFDRIADTGVQPEA